jgi:hypothetical protein
MKSWAVPAALIVGVEYLIALIIGMRVGFHYSIPFSAYAICALTVVVLAGVAALVIRLFVYARQGEEHPTRRLLSEAPRFSGFAVGTLLVGLQMGALTWMKIMLPIASSFWADPYLANVDHAIFHTDPWRIAYALFGWAAAFIDKAYITWAPIKFVTLIVLLTMSESPVKTRALLAYFVLMATGVIGQYVMPSAGPVFYAQVGFGDRFAGLPLEPWVASARDYLWRDYLEGGGNIGTGISAMPSLHVAVALWVALVVRALLPRLSAIGFAFFAVILVGSVMLGWHYAVDGIAAILITLFAWQVAALPHRSRRADQAIELRSVLS